MKLSFDHLSIQAPDPAALQQRVAGAAANGYVLDYVSASMHFGKPPLQIKVGVISERTRLPVLDVSIGPVSNR